MHTFLFYSVFRFDCLMNWKQSLQQLQFNGNWNDSIFSYFFCCSFCFSRDFNNDNKLGADAALSKHLETVWKWKWIINLNWNPTVFFFFDFLFGCVFLCLRIQSNAFAFNVMHNNLHAFLFLLFFLESNCLSCCFVLFCFSNKI